VQLLPKEISSSKFCTTICVSCKLSWNTDRPNLSCSVPKRVSKPISLWTNLKQQYIRITVMSKKTLHEEHDNQSSFYSSSVWFLSEPQHLSLNRPSNTLKMKLLPYTSTVLTDTIPTPYTDTPLQPNLTTCWHLWNFTPYPTPILTHMFTQIKCRHGWRVMQIHASLTSNICKGKSQMVKFPTDF